MTKKLETISDIEKSILIEIAYYFKNNIYQLGIKRLIFDENIIHILLSRPGLLIGKKGKDINKLSKILKEKLKNSNLKIHIEESKINNYLIDLNNLNY